MRLYNGQHQHWCGIDLHPRTMYLCLLDAQGQVLVHKNLRATPEAFLEAVAPYRDGLVVAVECIYTWYRLADLCAREGIAFVVGHALSMKAIHGGKAKNDRIDALKIATLLRGGMLPHAYAYPAGMRATRDLLRRRLHLVRKRGQLLAHIQMTTQQYNLSPLAKRVAYPANRKGAADDFPDPAVRRSLAVDLALLERWRSRSSTRSTTCNEILRDLELYLVAQAKHAVLFVRHSADGKKLLARLEKRFGKGKALSSSPTSSGGPSTSRCGASRRSIRGACARQRPEGAGAS